MPQFVPGEQKTATVLLVAVPAGLNYEAELTLGPDPGVAVATSGRVGFVSAGGQQEVIAPVAMPPGEGTFHVYVFVYHAGEVLGIYQADEDVIIEEEVMAEGARVYHSAYQDIPNVLDVSLAFNSENYDTDNIHDLANNSRLTCRTAGIYLIKAAASFMKNPTGYRVLTIRYTKSSDPGLHLPISTQLMNGDASFSTCHLETSTLWEMAVGDYVEAEVYQSSGAPLTVYGGIWGGYAYSPVFAMQRVGKSLVG